MTAKGELMGCYSTDVSSPVLAWAEISLPDDNSPENCVKFCIGVGFAYAGD